MNKCIFSFFVSSFIGNRVFILDGNSERGARKEQSQLFDLFKAFD